MFQAGPMIVSLWGRDQLAADGHTWEVAWIKALERRDDGSVALPT
jgi:hypothetical protein